MAQKNIALFIDADNAPATKIDVVLAELAKHGVVNIRKAYGNWASPNIKPWSDALHENAIQPIQQFDLTKQKNATDMAMAIDVMDVLYTKQIDIVCLVSSDCDFTPLAMRVRAEGKYVIGFGERKVPSPFADACSIFLYLDDPESDDTRPITPPEKLKSDTKLMNLLRQAIDAVAGDDDWAQLGPVGSHISNHSSFDPRNYGYPKLSDLFRAIDLFDCRYESNVVWVKDIRKAKKAGSADSKRTSTPELA